jgi:hypothetical protein
MLKLVPEQQRSQVFNKRRFDEEFGPFVDEDAEDLSNYPSLSALAKEKPADWQEAFEGAYEPHAGVICCSFSVLPVRA